MGVTRFLATSPAVISPAGLERIYFSGIDGIPVATTARWEKLVEVQRDISDSGNFHFPWPVRGHGELMLSTASLVEREKPYRLAVELARGTLSQLRNHAGEWQEIGLVPPEDFAGRIAKITQQFAAAATSGSDLAASESLSAEVIDQTIALGESLAAAFVEQAISVRKRQSPQLSTWQGASLEQTILNKEQARHFLASFNSAVVNLSWRQVEPTEGNYQWQLSEQQINWCRQQHLALAAGPLLKLDANGYPDWLALWEGDFENLVQLVTDYVSKAVNRFQGKIDLWICAARFAIGDSLSLSEDECLHLAARAVETTRQTDPDTPAILVFDQPWAEYMRLGRHQLSPLHVADALLRSELGLSGIGLELNLGYRPHGSELRTILSIGRLVDWWSSFGLPLYLFLTLPSQSTPDAAARKKSEIARGEDDPWTPAGQLEAAERIISLCVAKPSIRGVFWNQWRDDEPHDFPHGGLYESAASEKPLLTFLRRFRRRHLA